MSSVVRLYRRAVPPSVRQVITGITRRAVWEVAILRLRTTRRGTVPSDCTLDLLRLGWGNPLYAPGRPFLRAVAEQSLRGSGPIVEAGSGLTTVVVSHLAPDRPFVALEHIPSWADRVDRRTRRRSAAVQVAPLRDRGEFEWYEHEGELPLDIECFICDGPPGSSKGGRYGGLAVLRDRMRDGCVVLLDDVDRPGEADTLRRWNADFGVRAVSRSSGQGAYAVGIVTTAAPPEHRTPTT